MDIVVIGGGIIGSSIAWHLAPHANVTVVAEKLGGVATPLSFAWINCYTQDDTYYHFRNRSMDHWMEISKELPNLNIKFNGGLTFNMPPDEREKYYNLQKERGYNVIRVNRTEIHDIEPNLLDEYTPDWAVYAPQEGQMEAELVAIDLISHAKASGATILERTVSGFLKDGHGNVKGVVTPEGHVKADHVVMAAGLGSVDLLAAENITLPVQPREGLLVNSLPAKMGMVRTVYNGDPLHMRQTSYGVIRSSRDFAGGTPGDDPQAHANEVFAWTQNALVDGHELQYGNYTIGRRPQPDDGLPILGATGLNGLSVAVMHSGVTNAAIVGQLMAKLVLTNVTDPLMEPFLLSRF
ncbi:hypothetical protein JDV02_008095 [Purpureocillium takamizusanense]|uniref:FAD dependent oxidoreductase domain-containing protein n=1 Tax=Purpureocillium takamizusanense TaxID=2060973 RepID=A0A9Q8QP11_9HYPO|nr:uncharacterized protein JDV02_008095 [Purpureocillium takamizusanense]UNI22184.1 hypothetical protein JDV02_008095 [Purpureocillium takamizusanense]